ncbi:MAG: anti-sigma factor [Parasphingorhabdus sp.]|uniref:anti-sigma factor family protein n=1 Tax=Parasphingorhabdus sp. TaxID=2709688 RepID=UPI003001D0D3
MTFDNETIMTYVDGECDAVTAKRIEKAMETDANLAERVEQERALQNKLAAHYAPVMDEAIPDRLTSLLTGSLDSNVDTSFASRKSGQERALEQRRGFGFAQWGAMAATLAIGVAVGQFGLGSETGPFQQSDGALIASGSLETALEKQLASAQPEKSDYRIGLTFRAKSGDVCRSFTGNAVAGIACREKEDWRLHATVPGSPSGDYRQASSGQINAKAAELMADAPLDAKAERRLMEKGWK